MTKAQIEFVMACRKLPIGGAGNHEINGKLVHRVLPNLWVIDGEEYVGVNDLIKLA